MKNELNFQTADPSWKRLYLIGGVALLIIAAMYILAMAIYIPANNAGPSPDSVTAWLTLFQKDWLTGLFFLGLADIIIMIVAGPVFLALNFALRKNNKTWMLIATFFGFVGIAVYLATNTAFSMLSLSTEYTNAATESQKSLILAAGQSLLAQSQGTGGQYLGLPLTWTALLIISVLMLKSKLFGKLVAIIGIIGFPLLLISIPFAHYTTTGSTTLFVTILVAVTYIGGGLLSLLWYILVGLKLIKLGKKLQIQN